MVDKERETATLILLKKVTVDQRRQPITLVRYVHVIFAVDFTNLTTEMSGLFQPREDQFDEHLLL